MIIENNINSERQGVKIKIFDIPDTILLVHSKIKSA